MIESMDTSQPPDGISPEDWAKTPMSVQQFVYGLRLTVQSLEKRVADLEEKLGKNSSNSSKPPSSDPPGQTKPPRQPSGRKAGGQPGHVGQSRKLKPPEEVTRFVDLRPSCCADCGTLLMGEDASPARHQVTDIPRIEPEVVEYRCHTLHCLACGKANQAQWPEDMPTGAFGPRLMATTGYLTGRMGMSQRDVEELNQALFHVDVSLGSVAALTQRVSEALVEPVTEVGQYVQQQPVVNVDETSWRQKQAKGWLWLAATPLVTVFLLAATRSGQSAKTLLGEKYAGIVGSDRYSAYNWLEVLRRQLCWAHLKRDFQAFVERGGASATLGEALMRQEKLLFDLWYRVRDGTLSRAELIEQTQAIQKEVGCLLRQGAELDHPRTAGTCRDILKREAALWTFINVPGVEPTNNAAERPLRRAVLWRRRSFGTQSDAGGRFVERILTAVTTLRQQDRDVLDYLTEACAAAIRGGKDPSLLPIGNSLAEPPFT
jgi:transposase